MEGSLHFFDGSTQGEDAEGQNDNEPTASDDMVHYYHGSMGGNEIRQGPLSKTPDASNTTKGDLTQSYHETSPTDVAGYNQESTVGMMNMSHSPTQDNGSPATTTASNAEFDAIAREAALLLEKKLENNRVWVQRLLQEMTAYAQALSDVHSSYCHVQELEHNESQRLDQVEPDVQGATSHLLDTPYMAGLKNHFRPGGSGPTALGSKRKTDQA